MKTSKKVLLYIFLSQITVIALWLLVGIIQWVNNPKGSPGITIPLVVRSVEAFSIVLTSWLFIGLLERFTVFFNHKILRSLLILLIYPGSLIANFISLFLRDLLGYSPPKIEGFFFIQSLHFYIPILLVILSYGLIKNRMTAISEREQKLMAENLSQQARWLMLRYQVNPHFLFNALNSIRALVGHSDDEARKIITELSEYFRYTLSIEKKTLVKLREEIDAVTNYMEIQKIRFQDKINFEINTKSICDDILVPVFSIQTLAENAIKHGLKTSPDTLQVVIQCFAKDDQIVLMVKNSGKLVPVDQKTETGIGTGTGLQNLKDRLSYIYKGNARFSLNENEGWVIAKIEISNYQSIHENLEKYNS